MCVKYENILKLRVDACKLRMFTRKLRVDVRVLPVIGAECVQSMGRSPMDCAHSAPIHGQLTHIHT